MRLTIFVGGDFVTRGGGGFGWMRRRIGGSFGMRSGGGGFSGVFVVREAEELFRFRFGGTGSRCGGGGGDIKVVVAGAVAEVHGSIAAAHGGGEWSGEVGYLVVRMDRRGNLRELDFFFVLFYYLDPGSTRARFDSLREHITCNG